MPESGTSRGRDQAFAGHRGRGVASAGGRNCHARSSASDHACYAQAKDRKNSKRAALPEARKIIRQACHILAELGDGAFAAA